MDRLVRKAKLLPFAANHIIVLVLFLKSTPVDFEQMDASGNQGLLMLPEDILRLSYR
ncbi:MAG: hypothetical protein K2G29_09855 [Muribaculaceae bacterium]|nr:hypothetical protein [Muribaculaceae bacterium]MDE6423123.1 hypothetical protein [Muribaculaceae bacterium]